jgi:hypothetical protein
MKTLLVIAIVVMVPVLVRGSSSLAEAARKERARRAALAREGIVVRSFRQNDLPEGQKESPASVPSPRSSKPSELPAQAGAKERDRWRLEREKVDREVARLDAGIRRLESRLSLMRAKGRSRLRPEPAEEALVDSIENLKEERARIREAFLERGRKGGALPGWLR